VWLTIAGGERALDKLPKQQLLLSMPAFCLKAHLLSLLAKWVMRDFSADFVARSRLCRTMPRHSTNTERGSQVCLKKRKRVACIREALEARIRAPALSIRQLAAQHAEQLSRSVLQRRWNVFQRARDAGRSEYDALDIASSADGRGGHNRAFTPEQSQLLADIVLAAVPSMTHAQIKDEALHLHTAIHTNEHQTRSVPSPLGSFHASNGFVTRFKRTHALASHRTAVCYEKRIKVSDIEREEQYLDYVSEVHGAIMQYGARLVFNMDETAIAKIDPPTTAVVARGCGEAAKIHSHISSPGQQITTLPCISAAGDKLQLCAVLKGKTLRCLKKIQDGASAAVRGVRLYYSEKGWVNAELLCRWLREVVQPYTRSAPAALILDSYAAHFSPPVRIAAAAMNLELIQVPAGATAILQPLDVQYNSTLLNARKKIWREKKQVDAWTEDTHQAAIERQALAYAARTKAEGVAAFRKAWLLPAQ